MLRRPTSGRAATANDAGERAQRLPAPSLEPDRQGSVQLELDQAEIEALAYAAECMAGFARLVDDVAGSRREFADLAQASRTLRRLHERALLTKSLRP